MNSEEAEHRLKEILSRVSDPLIRRQALFGPHGLVSQLSGGERDQFIRSDVCKRTIADLTRSECEQASAMLRQVLDFEEGTPAERAQISQRPISVSAWQNRQYQELLRLAAVFVVVIILIWSIMRITQQRSKEQGPLSIESLQLVLHTHQEGKPGGEIGIFSFSSWFDDDVSFRAKLNEPAYCYLIAFNPDGKDQLLYPSDDKTPPSKTDSIGPLVNEKGEELHFALTDDTGLQAFVVVASPDPLPNYAEWKARLGNVPWKPEKDVSAGVWSHNGRHGKWLGDGTRANTPRPPPKAFDELCTFLRNRSGTQTVYGIAFPVLKVPEKDKPK